jgi:hypothetical protein
MSVKIAAQALPVGIGLDLVASARLCGNDVQRELLDEGDGPCPRRRTNPTARLDETREPLIVG